MSWTGAEVTYAADMDDDADAGGDGEGDAGTATDPQDDWAAKK